MEKRSESADPKRVNVKKIFCFSGLFTILFLCCFAVGAFLWAGGWVKKGVCSVVLDDSVIWRRFNCGKFSNEKESSTFTINQGDNVIDIKIPKDGYSTEELITSIIEQASPGVVTISVSTFGFDFEKGYIEEGRGIGSGFIVDSNGLIITNQHVVSDENADYNVLLPDEKDPIPVEKIYRDKTNDIAIIKVNKINLPALKLGDSDKLKRGNLVIAIGNPFGDLTGTATVGYVTGLNRDVTAGSGFFGSVTHYEGVIQTDAAINPGNSGGPLLNSSGEVIGINFATTQGADNISFAIPINRLKARLELFEKEGRFPQPYIGIAYTNRTVFLKKGIISGAVVVGVEKDSPAYKAGVKKGDIILKVNDYDMSSHDLGSIVQSSEVGDKLSLKIFRNGETIEIVVEVGDKGD